MGGATVARGKEARARVSASFIVVCPGSGKRRLTVFDRRGRRVEWVALILLAYRTGVSGGGYSIEKLSMALILMFGFDSPSL